MTEAVIFFYGMLFYRFVHVVQIQETFSNLAIGEERIHNLDG